jgi:serine/threonine protein kinase/tetratricopeptide (TPR) repeat protein
MTPDPKTALEIARRIADGESVDVAGLEDADPALARGLRKLDALAKAMQVGSEVGSSWGHLQQLQLAGQGGFGEVYRAYDPTLDRIVALKLKLQDAAGDVGSGRDFVAEARRLARVRHPHVLAVHGASYHDARAGLWADWIDGETLSARLQRAGALHGAELLRVLRELADALNAVHGSGLVHGDIKTSNVMLDTDSRVILMDFGAGFESSDEGSAISAGTPRYLAPEISAGKHATLAVDLYAFGVLAHLLATKRFPDKGQADAMIVPRGLRQLIARLLHPDPAVRPRADAIAAQVQALIDAPQRRLRLWLQTSVLLGLIGITLVTAVGIWREHAQRQLAESARDQARAVAGFLSDMLAAPAPEMRGRDVRVVDVLDAAVRRAQEAPDLSPSTRAGLLASIGHSQLALDRFRAADTTLTLAYALDTPDNALGAELALRIGLDLVEARSRREHYTEAAAVLSALAADRRWQGDTGAAAWIAIERAQWLQTQGEYDAALAMLAPLLPPRDDIETAIRLDALTAQADILFAQRRLADTERALHEALNLRSRGGGQSGNREYQLRIMLANVQNELGRFPEAEASYRQLLEWSNITFGENTLPSLTAAASMANALNSQGRFAETIALSRELLPKSESAAGKDGQLALTLRSNLAAALYQSGQLDAALAEYASLIALDESHFGATHPQTLVDRFNRLEALNVAGRHADALREAEGLRAVMIGAMGAEHLFTLETEDALGYALNASGRAVEAEAVHRRTFAIKTRVLGADNTYTLLSREYLARALMAQRRSDEARNELTTLLADRERVLGRAHPKTEVTRQLLVSLRDR